MYSAEELNGFWYVCLDGENMQRIVARAPWGDTYSAQDAEDGCIPSEAWEVEEVEG